MPSVPLSNIFIYLFDTVSFSCFAALGIWTQLISSATHDIILRSGPCCRCCSTSHEERLWARQEVMWERDMKRWDAERALWTMREQQMQQQISDLQGLVVSCSCLTCGKTDAVCTPAKHIYRGKRVCMKALSAYCLTSVGMHNICLACFEASQPHTAAMSRLHQQNCLA